MTNGKNCPYTNKTYLFFFPTISNLKILRRKRYPIPAQNVATGQSGRIWGHFPAQAATFFHSAQKKIPHSRAERCHGAFRAGRAANSRAGGYNFPFCAGNDTPFLRRRVPRVSPGAFGGIFLRRRLQFFLPSRKRYLIPAQKGATGRPARVWGLIPAQKATTDQSARKNGPIPAQAAAILRSKGSNTSICYYSYGIVQFLL